MFVENKTVLTNPKHPSYPTSAKQTFSFFTDTTQKKTKQIPDHGLYTVGDKTLS